MSSEETCPECDECFRVATSEKRAECPTCGTRFPRSYKPNSPSSEPKPAPTPRTRDNSDDEDDEPRYKTEGSGPKRKRLATVKASKNDALPYPRSDDIGDTKRSRRRSKRRQSIDSGFAGVDREAGRDAGGHRLWSPEFLIPAAICALLIFVSLTWHNFMTLSLAISATLVIVYTVSFSYVAEDALNDYEFLAWRSPLLTVLFVFLRAPVAPNLFLKWLVSVTLLVASMVLIWR